MLGRNCVRLAFRVVDNRYRTAPITLAAHEPIADAVLRRLLSTHFCDNVPLRQFCFAYRQIEFLGEFTVAFVVGGDGHNRTGAVGSNHIVSDENGDLFFCRGINRHDALELHAGLFFILTALALSLLRGRIHIFLNLFFI